MSLLDGLFSDDPQKAAAMAMAFGLLNSRNGKNGLGADLGQAGLLGLQTYSTQKGLQARLAEEAQQKQMREMQMEQMRRSQADDAGIRGAYQRNVVPGMPQMQPTDMETPTGPQGPSSMNLPGLRNDLMGMGPAGFQEAARLAALTVKERVKLGPGETIGSYQGDKFVPSYSAPDKPPAGFTRGPNGELVVDKNWLAAQEQLRKAGQPNISVTTGNTMAGELGKGTGELLNNGRTSAISAVDTITTGNQVREALDSGKVMAGPGTSNVRIPLAQVAPMFGLSSDPEGLVKTRQVIIGMANQALNARGSLKGQGQISDFEGKVLEKAKAGNIDSMTVPEIRALVDVNDRAARATIQRHNKMVEQLGKDPQFAGVIPFFSVEEPQHYGQKPSMSLDAIEAEILRRRARGSK